MDALIEWLQEERMKSVSMFADAYGKVLKKIRELQPSQRCDGSDMYDFLIPDRIVELVAEGKDVHDVIVTIMKEQKGCCNPNIITKLATIRKQFVDDFMVDKPKPPANVMIREGSSVERKKEHGD